MTHYITLTKEGDDFKAECPTIETIGEGDKLEIIYKNITFQDEFEKQYCLNQARFWAESYLWRILEGSQ